MCVRKRNWYNVISGSDLKRKRGKEKNILTRRVRERVHFWARPTTEKGSQWVGMKEWRSETVVIPPMVGRSSAVRVFIAISTHHQTVSVWKNKDLLCYRCNSSQIKWELRWHQVAQNLQWLAIFFLSFFLSSSSFLLVSCRERDLCTTFLVVKVLYTLFKKIL